MSADEVLKYIATNEIRWVDLQFFDLAGRLHKTTVSNKDIDEYAFTKGTYAANLSEIFGPSPQGELLLLPDANSLARMPWEPSSIRLMCDIVVAGTGERFLKDSRYVAQRAQTNLEALGVKASRIGLTTEFYIMDSATMDRTTKGRGTTMVMDSRESYWSPSPLSTAKSGAYLSQPYDSMYAARVQVAETLEDHFGVIIDAHRHGKGKTSQQSIDLHEQNLMSIADGFVTLKFVVRNLANAVNAATTFMPYPIEGESGSSLSVSMSLWKTGENNVFYEGTDEYAQVSQIGRYFIGGLLEHAAALSLFTMPTANSYKRLSINPKIVAWSKTNKSALVEVPHVRKNDKEGKRIVFTAADPSINSHLALAAIITAGVDGIKRKVDPGDPTDDEKGEVKKRKWEALPTSLYEAIQAFEADPKFVKGVIPTELLENYIDLKVTEFEESQRSLTAWELQEYWNF